MSTIPESIVLQILSAENSSQRFESYANKIVSELEGTHVLSTSKSWDLGRDGRSVAGPTPIYTCCSLRKDIETKSEADIKRLLDFTQPNEKLKIYFCFSQPLSEYARETIKATVRALHPTRPLEIEVLGAGNLAQLDIKFHNEKGSSLGISEFYPSEFKDLLQILKDQENTGTDERSLRLALLTMGPDDSVAIRAQAYRSLILHALHHSTKGLGNEGLAQTIGDRLRLGHPLPFSALKAYLDQLIEEGLITHQDKRFTITAVGIEHITQEREQAASRLLNGRHAVRTHLESLLGKTLSPDEFDAIWSAVEERLGNLFYTRGEAILRSTAALLNQEEKPTEIADYSKLIDELADAAANAWSIPGKKAEVARAIKDMLTEGTGPACEWLIRICCSFVTLCSIGLESSSAGAIRKIISNTEAVLDTDVILSLLGPGEPLHEDIVDAHRRWTTLGGKVLLAYPVAEELAHHAWISDVDYQEVQSWLPGTFEDGLRQIRNVFTRGFAALLRQKKARKRDWNTYISQFRGITSSDTEPIKSFLSAEYGFKELPHHPIDESSIGGELYSKVKARVDAQLKSGVISEKPHGIILDKAKRDAQLTESIAARRKELSYSGQGTCCLVSSSQRLRDLPVLLGSRHADVPWVISPATWICMLALVPGISVGLTAMRSFLFDDYLRYRPEAHEQVLLRALRESNQHTLSWAGRVTLFKNVQTSVFKMANSLGVTRASVKKMIEHPADSEQNKQVAATVLAEALDEMASESRIERELRERIRKLEEENRQLRKKR
jgi:hypothetical protein